MYTLPIYNTITNGKLTERDIAGKQNPKTYLDTRRVYADEDLNTGDAVLTSSARQDYTYDETILAGLMHACH
jgi:hypothetical protein